MQWTLEQLRQFVTAAECGSFSAAARRLGRVQSAVSTAIALLEADLGVTLFDRSRRNAVLTDAGEVLMLEARAVLQQAQGLENRALALALDAEARLTLSLDEALPYMVVNAVITELARQYPHLELTLLSATAVEVADHVARRSADIAFHFDRGPLGVALEQRRIGSVAQGVFVASDHPLAQRGEVARSELARYRQIIMHQTDLREGVFSPSVWRADSFYSIAEMVANGLGWAVLPVNIARYESHKLYLVEISCVALALAPLSVRMLWPQGTPLPPSALWLQARMGELFG